jgi:hypothetical protein
MAWKPLASIGTLVEFQIELAGFLSQFPVPRRRKEIIFRIPGPTDRSRVEIKSWPDGPRGAERIFAQLCIRPRPRDLSDDDSTRCSCRHCGHCGHCGRCWGLKDHAAQSILASYSQQIMHRRCWRASHTQSQSNADTFRVVFSCGWAWAWAGIYEPEVQLRKQKKKKASPKRSPASEA